MSYTKKVHNTTYPSISPALPQLSLAGKTVLITGGGAGIGATAALAFAKAGATTIVLLGRRPELLSKTASSIQATHPSATLKTFAVDILDPSALRTTFEAVSPIDVVVHAAGTLGSITSLATTPASTFAAALATNINGTFNVLQAMLPHLAEGAVYINFTTAGILFPPAPGLGTYLTSKMAVLKLVECFSAENPTVRVMHVHPGIQKTEMAGKLEECGVVFPYDEREYIVFSHAAVLSVFADLVECSISGGRFPRLDCEWRGCIFEE